MSYVWHRNVKEKKEEEEDFLGSWHHFSKLYQWPGVINLQKLTHCNLFCQRHEHKCKQSWFWPFLCLNFWLLFTYFILLGSRNFRPSIPFFNHYNSTQQKRRLLKHKLSQIHTNYHKLSLVSAKIQFLRVNKFGPQWPPTIYRGGRLCPTSNHSKYPKNLNFESYFAHFGPNLVAPTGPHLQIMFPGGDQRGPVGANHLDHFLLNRICSALSNTNSCKLSPILTPI